jgi:hypothetical protein
MKLRKIINAQPGIDRLLASNELSAKIAYKLSKFSRRYREVLQDVSAFERKVMDSLKLEPDKKGQLVHEKQDMTKLAAYLAQRNTFIQEEETDLEVPVLSLDDVENVGLSGNELMALMTIGIIEDPEPDPEPEPESEPEPEPAPRKEKTPPGEPDLGLDDAEPA